MFLPVYCVFKIIRSHYTDDLRMTGATFRGWLSSHSLKIFSELFSPWGRSEHKFMLYPHIITICKQVLVTLSSHFHCETPRLPFKTLAKSSGHSFNPAGEGQRTSQSQRPAWSTQWLPGQLGHTVRPASKTTPTKPMPWSYDTVRKWQENGLHSEETSSVSVSVLIPSNGRIPSHSAGWLHETPSICTNCILSHTLFAFA